MAEAYRSFHRDHALFLAQANWWHAGREALSDLPVARQTSIWPSLKRLLAQYRNVADAGETSGAVRQKLPAVSRLFPHDNVPLSCG